jgi:hypothetical protein
LRENDKKYFAPETGRSRRFGLPYIYAPPENKKIPASTEIETGMATA